MFVFLMDFAAERYVEKKYNHFHGVSDVEQHRGSVDQAALTYSMSHRQSTHQALHSGEQDGTLGSIAAAVTSSNDTTSSPINGKAQEAGDDYSVDVKEEEITERSFQQQIAAFLILEFGVIFHSVIIGLTLGTAGSEFNVLYPVIVFHQSFEGMGIGARLSAIPFPRRVKWLPWFLCTGYGLTTPLAIAVGLGVRTTYNAASDTANIVSGVLDSISAGILIYTGFVELLARDFLFNPERTRNDRQLTFMICCVLLGAGIMALLGKWA